MTAKLLLFDVDATLLHSGGAGRRSMNLAFKELHSVDDAFDGIIPDGNTDPRIFREIMALRGLDSADSERSLHEIAARYTHHLRAEMPRSAAARVMPGVTRLLDRLSGRSGLLVGLLTGNLEATARIKLEHFGLNRFFPFGAFASDDEERSALVPVAVARAEELAGRRIGLGRHVVVIGDSPLDVACALANGATAVGVATGSSTTQQLLQAGAHVVFQNLADTEAVIAALTEL